MTARLENKMNLAESEVEKLKAEFACLLTLTQIQADKNVEKPYWQLQQ